MRGGAPCNDPGARNVCATVGSHSWRPWREIVLEVDAGASAGDGSAYEIALQAGAAPPSGAGGGRTAEQRVDALRLGRKAAEVRQVLDEERQGRLDALERKPNLRGEPPRNEPCQTKLAFQGRAVRCSSNSRLAEAQSTVDRKTTAPKRNCNESR